MNGSRRDAESRNIENGPRGMKRFFWGDGRAKKRISAIFGRAAALGCVVLAWWILSRLVGRAMIPAPGETLLKFAALMTQWKVWESLLITFFRVVAGLISGCILAVLLAVPSGLRPFCREFFSPLIFAIQACPTILWISMVLVWSGSGSIVPISAVALIALPVLFFNLTAGLRSIDTRLFRMAGFYNVPVARTLRLIVVPGLSPSFFAGFAFASSVAWKVAVTAEFIASGSGVGSDVYWAYRSLDMPLLFSWTIVLVLIGILIEALLPNASHREIEE